ncbi:hypothetical protein D0463_17135 [Bacillus sp. V59.32b]|nr:hypothetical protein D0463_17135 [Bacillus sp. V59.32b]
MCGRYTLFSKREDIINRFDIEARDSRGTYDGKNDIGVNVINSNVFEKKKIADNLEKYEKPLVYLFIWKNYT